MKLPTLYSRTNGGAIQTLVMEIEGNKYRAITGQVDGKKTESGWKVAKAKSVGRSNATTAEAQAIAEAQAKWDKKAKRGYTPNINDVDNCMSYVEAMLAGPGDDYVDSMDFSKGVLLQNKFNGVRAITVFEDGEVVSKSRGGELWTAVPHILIDLKKFFIDYPEAVLDGEYYNYDLRQRLCDLISIVRTARPNADEIKESEKMVRYYVYDGYGFDGMDESTPYETRKAWLDKTLPKYTKYVVMVETTEVHSRAELEKFYEHRLAELEEGAIIRFKNMPYEHKRSKFLLKYKPEDDAEGVILAIIEGTGNWAGTAKTAQISWNGKIFEATFKGSMALGKQRLADQKSWIGKTVTFLYTGLTGKGVPNFARIDPANCFKGDR